MWRLLMLALLAAGEESSESDGDSSRKILGSSVVTSVSVIMDTGNGSKIYTDAVGKPVSKPLTATDLASPIDLLNPDRYEFYTFDDSGDLVKRLMTLEEIQDIVATGDGDGFSLDSFTSNGFIPEKRVNDVVNNVQNVLKEEIKMHKDSSEKPQLDTPDVSDSWSMILPAVFGNSGEDIKPEKPALHLTPDTIMIEPTTAPLTPQAITFSTEQISTTQKVETLFTKKTPTTTTTTTTEPQSMISVEIITNSNSTTERPDNYVSENLPVVEIRPTLNDFELFKDNSRPASQKITASTVKPTASYPSRPMKFTLPSTTGAQTTTRLTTRFTATQSPNTVKRSTITTTISPIRTTSLPAIFQKLSVATQQATTSSTSRPPTSTLSTQTTEVQTSTTDGTRTPVVSTATDLETSAASSIFAQQSSTTNAQTTTTSGTPSSQPSTSSAQTTSGALTTSTQQSTTSSTSSTTNSSPSFTSTREQVVTTEISPEPSFTTLGLTTINDGISGSSESTTQPDSDSTTTKNLENQLPTLTQLLNSWSSTITGKAPTTTTTTNSPLSSSTFGDLSTFFIVADNKIRSSTTSVESSTDPQSTTVLDSSTTTSESDLNTLSTEYLPLQTITVSTTREVPNSSLIGTTELSEEIKTPAPEVLDKLLLTSTNIYEINSALTQTTTALNDFVTYESTTGLEDDQPKTTEKFLIRVSDIAPPATTTTEIPTTTDTTTDQSLIQSIEQLLSQAVGPVEPQIVDNNEAEKVQQMMVDSFKKTMPQLQKETATLASNLVASSSSPNFVTTTDMFQETTTEDDDSSLIDDAITSILSQVSNLGSTTLDNQSSPPTTIVTEDSSTTETFTTMNQGTTAQEIAATTTAKPQDFVPHIINITLISNDNIRKNQSKPAKSDTSLEMEYDEIINELKKNGSLVETPSGLVSTSSQTEILQTEATSSIQSQKEDEEPSTEDLNDFEGTSTVVTTVDDSTTTKLVTESETETTTLIGEINSTESELVTSSTTVRSDPKPSIVITVNESAKNATSESENDTNDTSSISWTLVSTLAPHSDTNTNNSEPSKESSTTSSHPIDDVVQPLTPVDLNPKPLQGFGLDASTAKLDPDIHQFIQLCNELAFGFWRSVTTGLNQARSVFVSPFAATSLLAMVFLGARGATSGEMNEILKLDDMVTFNPHLIFKNVSESIETEANSGVAASAIVRELYSDRSKGKLLGFYKDRVKQFYDGHVEEASFREIGDVIRRRTNLLVKKNTNGKIGEFLKDMSIKARPPLAGVSASVFQTDCSQASTDGRDGELHFVVLPSIRQRRLIPIPAVVFRSGFLAGYEPSLDATAVALGTHDQAVSTVLVIPGQQGSTAPGDGLTRLEKRLVESSFKQGAWSRLLRTLIPRPGVELQIPRFLHRSIINATVSLKKMGLRDLFDSSKADLKGLNGAAHELYLSDILQINEFATCGEGRIGDTHLREVYPTTPERSRRYVEDFRIWEEPRDYQRAFHDPSHDPSLLSLPLPLRPRQARVPDIPRLRFDRPFLYFVRHNPSGIILHMGRFHPRLLP